jgi:hypothetical protein
VQNRVEQILAHPNAAIAIKKSVLAEADHKEADAQLRACARKRLFS